MFKVGDLAVYPAHGVGKIEAIETKSIGGYSQDFYIMRILENDMKIMIPVQNAQMVGLRRIIEEKEVHLVYEILRRREISVNSSTWNRRYREYMEKIKTGSIYELAEVLRDLTVLQNDKELSFGERKMLETARALLVTEVAMARGAQESQIACEIDEILR